MRRVISDRPHPTRALADWQIDQGRKCGCRGTDDMCPCQNEYPWPKPLVSIEEIEDLIADAMSDVHDMDTTLRDFARAAVQALLNERLLSPRVLVPDASQIKEG